MSSAMRSVKNERSWLPVCRELHDGHFFIRPRPTQLPEKLRPWPFPNVCFTGRSRDRRLGDSHGGVALEAYEHMPSRPVQNKKLTLDKKKQILHLLANDPQG